MTSEVQPPLDVGVEYEATGLEAMRRRTLAKRARRDAEQDASLRKHDGELVSGTEVDQAFEAGFRPSWDAFQHLKEGLVKHESLALELEIALKIENERVDSRPIENRRLVSDFSKWIIVATALSLRSMESNAPTQSELSSESALRAQLAEIQRIGNQLWTIRSTSSTSTDGFRIAGLRPEEPSHCVSALLAAHNLRPIILLRPYHLPGLTYLDPSVHVVRFNRYQDSLWLRPDEAKAHADDHPECVIKLNLPENIGVGTLDPALLYVRGFLATGSFPALSRGLL